MRTGIEWIVTDYGGVLSLPQSDEDNSDLARIAGAEPGRFKERYWHFRSEFDRADLSPGSYWERVLEQPVDSSILRRLTVADTESWVRPNLPVLDVYARLTGRRLLLLSNAPTPLARAIEGLAWLPKLARMYFSCDLRLSKPDKRIYDLVVSRLGTNPGTVLLVDDRRENIVGAEGAGLATHLYTGPESLAEAIGLPASES